LVEGVAVVANPDFVYKVVYSQAEIGQQKRDSHCCKSLWDNE